MTPRVLIVDDDGNNRLLLETLLTSRGFDVIEAVNGEDGMAKARSHHPDLIVSDILMPVMDGYAFCRQLKLDDDLKRIPLVFFTASYDTPKDEAFALSLGAARFVSKPLEPEDLIAILEDVLTESRSASRVETKPLGEEMEFFRQHNEVLFGQLEKKLLDLQKANERLRTMEEKYRLSFENITDLVLVFDVNLTLTSVSPSAERILGYRPEEFVGRPIDDLKKVMTRESFDLAAQSISQILEGKIITSAVYDVIARDGTLKYLDISGSPLMREGRIDGLVCDARDVTDRVLAENAQRESEELFGQFMRYFPGSAYIKDSDRRIISVMGNIQEYFGVEPQEWLGKRSEDIWPEEIALSSKNEDEAVLRGEVVQSITKRPQKDGTHHWITHRFPIHRHNKPPLIGCISLDITRQIQAEEALRDSVAKLRKALGGTIQAIASVVETKDPYTAGHQRRVADIARAIAREMKMPQERIEGLRMAAIIHDIGKVSVPSEILSSPRKLTPLEFSLIKTHSQSGCDIVRKIEFPWPIARMIIEHHERMDGSGYPEGLTGDQLLPESRILAVADVVEAMATHRPYRPSLGLPAALDEIAKNRGRLYDPDVVDACLCLFREKGYVIQD